MIDPAEIALPVEETPQTLDMDVVRAVGYMGACDARLILLHARSGVGRLSDAVGTEHARRILDEEKRDREYFSRPR